MNRKKIEDLARKYNEKLQKRFNDPRYKKVIGKFITAGLLEHTKVLPYRGPITLEEVLWVGETEPRVLELLPAILLRRPTLVRVQNDLPEDLRQVLVALRKGIANTDFRGVPHDKYGAWVERMGRKVTPPSVLKTFRFQREDVEKLNSIKKLTGLNETEIIRKALERF